jgi:hypothetical protein
MVMTKRYIPKKRKRSSVVPYRRRYPSLPSPYAATRLNARVGGFLGFELKYNDTRAQVNPTTDVATCVLNPTQNCLFAPTQGTSAQSRDGAVIAVYSLQLRIRIVLAATTGAGLPPPNHACKVLIVMDSQTNGAEAVGSDILENPGGTVYDILAFPKLENRTRFKVLRQKVYNGTHASLAGVTGSLEQQSIEIFDDIYIKFKKPIMVRFTGNAGTVSDIADNSFHFLAISNASTVNTITYQCRARFTG